MRADKYHQGVPTDRWQPYRFHDPKIAAIAAVAMLLGATMTTGTQTFTSPGTWTAPANFIPGSAVITVAGQGTGGDGAVITASVPGSPATLTCTPGYHAGGSGTGSGSSGGSSSAVLQSGTLLAEAGGSGGTGAFVTGSLGTGGNGGTPNGQQGGARGAGIGGVSGAGGAVGGNASGGGNGGGGGGGNGPGSGGSGLGTGAGGGGGGGGSYVAPSLTGVSMTASNSGAGYVIVSWQIYNAPLVPTLTSPANAAFIDSNAAGVAFKATYNQGSAGPLSAVALRVSKDGAAYGYWNGTNFTSTTPVWNTGGTISGIGAVNGGTITVTVPAAILVDGHTYTWSIACQEASQSLQGSFASDSAFTAGVAPTINSLSPTGTATSTTPVVSWAETLGSGDTQSAYRYMIYAASSTPGTPGALYDTGVVASSALFFTVPSSAGLNNGITYFGYLQITETPGPASSSWFAASFTVSLDGPATPTIVVTQITDPTTGLPEPQITITQNDNLDTSDDSSFEAGDVGSYTATNATLTNSTTWAADGSDSLQASSTASGTVTVLQGTAAPCTPGQIVTAMATVQQPSLTQTITLSVKFLNSSGGTISTVAIASAAASSTGVALSGQSTAAPAGTVSVVKVITYTATAASQITRFDKMGTFLGTVATWTVGGIVGASNAEVQYSYDGVTWADLRFGAAVTLVSQSGQVIDYETPYNKVASYRARITSVSGTQTLTSAWSSVATITIPSLQWGIVDPVTPTRGMLLTRVDSGGGTVPPGTTAALVIDRNKRQGIFRGMGSSVAIVINGDLWADEFDITLFFDSEALWQTFDKIRSNSSTVLLKSDMTGHVYYMSLGASRPASTVSESGRQSNPRKGLTMHCTPVAKP